MVYRLRAWWREDFHLRSGREPLVEDPLVAPIEEILAAAGTTTWVPGQGRPRARNLLWLCLCETLDATPVWLLHDGPAKGVAWSRLPEELERADDEELVDFERIMGGHGTPHQVLPWLRGEKRWPGHEDDWCDDPDVADAIISRIR